MNLATLACAMCGQPADSALANLIGGIWHTCICRSCARRRLVADGGLALTLSPAGGPVAMDLGEIQIRPGAVAALSESGEHYWDYLERHAAGDRGSFRPTDDGIAAAFLNGPGHVISEYRTGQGQRLWLMTAPGQLTALLVPGEY